MRRPRTFKPRTRKPKQLALSIVKAPGVYASPAWLELRYRALRLSNGRCECCGARATSANPLHARGEGRGPTRSDRRTADTLFTQRRTDICGV